MVSEYLIWLLYTINTITYNLSGFLLIFFKNQKYLELATLPRISFPKKMNCLYNFLKRSELDATKTLFGSLTCGMQAQEHRADKNQCLKPGISCVFNVGLNRTRNVSVHLSKLQPLEPFKQIETINHINMSNRCAMHFLGTTLSPQLDSWHVCSTALPALLNCINKIQKKNVTTRITGRSWLSPQLWIFSLFCWKAFSTIKAHLTLTLIKANR